MAQPPAKPIKKKRFRISKDDLTLHIMAVPALVVLLLFSYLPMGGIIIAFKKLNVAKGIFASDWIGLKNFEFLFASTDAWNITRNTNTYYFYREQKH